MISSFDVHPGGEHLVVGSYDSVCFGTTLIFRIGPSRRCDSTTRPSVRPIPRLAAAVCRRQRRWLAADLHARVYNDLMENPTIVPLKMLKVIVSWSR